MTSADISVNKNSYICSSPAVSPPSPAREPESQTAVSVNSVQAPVAQLQNSDAFAAVAQLFQSSQGQQVRYPVIPEHCKHLRCSDSVACSNATVLTAAPADAPNVPAAWEAPVSSTGE